MKENLPAQSDDRMGFKDKKPPGVSVNILLCAAARRLFMSDSLTVMVR